MVRESTERYWDSADGSGENESRHIFAGFFFISFCCALKIKGNVLCSAGNLPGEWFQEKRHLRFSAVFEAL